MRKYLRTITALIGGLVIALSAVNSGVCLAENTITVTGIGKASVRPDTVTINGLLSGNAKSAEEALVKFQQAKRRLLEAVAKTEIEGVSAKGSGVSVQTSTMPVGPNGQVAADPFGNAQPKPADARYIVKESITLKMTGIDEAKDEDVLENILTLIGVAEDHGATLASDPNAMMMMMFGNRMNTELPIATFVVSDPEELHQKAYEAAVAAGAKRVKTLTAITNKKVGALVSIEEVSVGDVKSGEKDPYAMMKSIYGINVEETKDPDYSAKELGDIEGRVVLKLTFQISE